MIVGLLVILMEGRDEVRLPVLRVQEEHRPHKMAARVQMNLLPGGVIPL